LRQLTEEMSEASIEQQAPMPGFQPLSVEPEDCWVWETKLRAGDHGGDVLGCDVEATKTLQLLR